MAKDRNTHHVVEVVELPSYEEATRNSNLPETNRIFEEIVALCASHIARSSGVVCCFLDELYPRVQSKFGVDVGEVGLHGPG